jgi:predicted RNase H-like nuclease (RuvC/YqgF family)
MVCTKRGGGYKMNLEHRIEKLERQMCGDVDKVEMEKGQIIPSKIEKLQKEQKEAEERIKILEREIEKYNDIINLFRRCLNMWEEITAQQKNETP